jgi:predicted DsbA family dithiol-disulfide isomerase
MAATGHQEDLSESISVARQLGIRGTPSFVVGRRVDERTIGAAYLFSGARSFEDFRRAIELVVTDTSD